MGQLIKINTKATEDDELTAAAESYTAGKGALVKIGSKAASTTQTGAQSAPRSVGTSAPGVNRVNTASDNRKMGVSGKAAESGYTTEKKADAQKANRQALAQIGKNVRKSFGGLQNAPDNQRELALERKMGVGDSWKDTAGSLAIESGVTGSAASMINALGTALKSDRKSGLAVDNGDVEPDTTGDEWYNRAGRKLQSAADKVQAYSDDAYTRGTEGLNTAQKLLFDTAVAGTQMAVDAGIGLVTGGAAIPMAIRGFGSGSMQARQAGATENQQITYGAASAAVEALTEKMFDGVAKIYGKGVADDAVQKFAEKIAKTPQGQSFVRALAGMGGEGLEEMVSGVVDPALQTIYNDKKLGDGAYDDVKLGDILYQGAVGALMGMFGGAADIAQTARGERAAAGNLQTNEKTGVNLKRDGLRTPTNEKTSKNFNREGLQATGKKKSSPSVRESVVAESQRAATAVQEQKKQDAADVPRLLTPEEHVAKLDDEAVERILEAFAADSGYVSRQRQEQLIGYHGEDLFYRAVEEGFKRGAITNDGAGNIYSLKPETRAPGYYGSRGKGTKYLDSLAKAANMTILRGDLGDGEMGFYINGRAVLAEDAGVEIARHEVAHHLKQVAPEEFNAFLDYVKGVYGGKVDEAMEAVRSDYAQRGETLDDATAEEELAAYYAGQLLTDETAMKRLAGENLSLAERILDWLKQSLAKLRRAFGGEDVETKQLREAAELFENAIRAAKNGTVETDGAVRHSFGDTEIKREYIAYKDYDRTNAKVEEKASELIGKGKAVELSPQKILGYETAVDWGNKQAVRKLLEEILEPNLGVSVHFDHNGKVITAYLTRDGINHAKGGAASPRKAAAYEAYNELVKNAEYAYSTPHDAHSKKGTTGGENTEWDTFVAVGTINGEPYPVAFTVRTIDTETRSQVYAMATKKETDFSHGGGSRNNPTVAHPNYGSSPISNETLTQPPTTVKNDGLDTQNSGKRSAYEGTAEQLKEIQRLQRQNERLEEQLWNLRNRVQGVPLAGTDRASVKKQVQELKKRYGSKVSTNELTEAVAELYDGIMDRVYTDEEMRQKAREIADRIIDGVAVQSNPMYEEYEDLRKALRKSRVSVPAEYRADLEQAGGYNALRQKNMGRLTFANDGTPVDVLYEDLSERYPTLFPDDVYNPADQIVQISDVLDELAAVEDNPFSQTPAVREFLAGDILERYFDTPQTYAAQLQRDRAKAAEQMRKMQETHKQQLNAMEQRHAAENQERRERATAGARREQLMKGTERLTKKLIRPDDKRHIPAEMRETVRAFVSMVNTESGYEYVFQRDGTYKRVKAGSDPYGMSTARTDRARELQAQLRLLEEDGSASIDPNLQANLDAIAEMQETKIADMNREQLDLVYETMRAIEKMCQNSDKMLGESKFATVSKVANELLEESRGRKTKTQWNEKVQWIDDMAEIEMMTPETFFHKMGKAGDELYRQMRRSADKQTHILAEGVEHAKKVIGESGLDIKALEHEVHDFELESGEKLTMTTAQIMELHALWKREQARDHILEYGGIKPTKIEGKGLRASAAVRAEKVSLNDLAKILSVLTNEQRALVDNLQKFMAGGLAQHGNEASRMVYGYDKFTEPNYWPIHVNKAEVATDPGKAAQAKTIVGFGMAKATKPKASNGLEIGSFLDTYTKHLSEMATYAGWLATSENLTRVNNFKFTDGTGMPTGETVKTVLEKVYGRGGDAYWQKLMGDIAQGTKAGSDGTKWDWITANTKAAAVGANLRVILQQPTSILRAMNMVHPKYFTKQSKEGTESGWEKALKYSGIAQWKDWGYFEMDTGRSVRGLITGPESKVEKWREASMAAAGKMDSMSWGILWNAVEAETAERFPELKGEDIYKAAAERFGEVIDRTQVVDSVLHRSQIMRKGGVNKMATSFMSEPSKIYNMMLRDIYDVSAASEGEAKNRAKKRLARTAGALTASFALNAVAQSIADAMRDDDREKEYWEKFFDNWTENFADNFNALNYVPYVKDIVSIFSGYDVSRMDMDAISDAKQAADQLAKAIKGTGKKTVANAGIDMANEVAAIFGLPMANIKRDLLAAVNTAFSEARLYRMQYELDKVLYDIDYTGSRVRWWKILYAASKDNWGDYEAIYRDMIKQGLTDEQIKKGMENLMKADQGVSSVKELKYRWTPPGERSEFNTFSKQISEAEGQKKALDLGW